MDPRMGAAGNVLVPLVLGAVFGLFLWLESDLGVMHVWFKSIYRDSHPRAFWLLRAPLGIAALVCCMWAGANFWHVFAVPYLGNPAADIVLFLSFIAVGAAIIATDFHFGRVWITFRFSWPYPVWRDQNPAWFWFWEGLQVSLSGVFLAYAVPKLIGDVCQLVSATRA